MEREALHKAAIRFSLDLHPSATGDVMEGVRDQLNAVLLRYSTYLEGVLVSYTQPRIVSQQARIHPYFPYFHVDVLADCVLFKPAAGHILDGKVHMVSHDFIGLLVLGLFNVSIGRQHIRTDLSYDAIRACWQSQRHENHRIAVGTALRFKVDRVDDESEFFTLAGSLLAPGTGDVVYVSQQARKSNKKRRHSEATATDAPASAARTAANAPVPAPTSTARRSSVPAAAVARTPSAPSQAANASATPSAEAAATGRSASKVDKKAAKAVAKAAVKEAAAAVTKEPVKSAAAPAAASPSGDAGAGSSRDGPGDNTDVLPPKKKKRRKHQDTPTQATTPAAAAARSTAPASTAPKPPKHVHQAGSNGPAALAGGAANSPARFSPANGAAVASAGGSHAAATGRTHHADQATANGSSEQQATAAVENGAADPGQDGKKVKQKSHKKKKRERDKAASPLAAPVRSGPDAAMTREEPVPNHAATTASEQISAANGSIKKHKKHKEKKGEKQN